MRCSRVGTTRYGTLVFCLLDQNHDAEHQFRGEVRCGRAGCSVVSTFSPHREPHEITEPSEPSFDDYQAGARSTAVYPNIGANIEYPTLGLAGEAGEIANKVKKIYRDAYGVISPERNDEICDELGDVLWYIAAIASELNCPLGLIAVNNLAKLRNRQERGTLQGSGDDR